MASRGATNLISTVSLALGFGTIWLAWPVAEALVIPPQARLSIPDLVHEHLSYWANLDSYLAWRWPPLIAWHYPFAFLLAVGVGLLAYGVISTLLRGGGAAWC